MGFGQACLEHSHDLKSLPCDGHAECAVQHPHSGWPLRQTDLSYQCSYIWVNCRDTFCQTSGRLGARHCSIMHLSHQGHGHARHRIVVSEPVKIGRAIHH